MPTTLSNMAPALKDRYLGGTRAAVNPHPRKKKRKRPYTLRSLGGS